MFNSTQIKESTGRYHRILFSVFSATICLAVVFSTASAQTPTPTPVETNTATWNGYRVTSVIEIGWRFRSLNGNENKYRSDLNYKAGFRSFDTNLLLQSATGKGKAFDSLLISNSGWGSDPSGSTRINMEKTGLYKFSANVRRVTYFNNLFNYANPLGFTDSEHNQNTNHTFGDFDVTFLPQNERLRITLGTSFNRTRGPGGTTVRFFGDEFPVSAETKSNSADFRVGAEGKLLGFNWVLSQGIRTFRDRSNHFLTAPNQGNTTTNQSRLDTFSRVFPTDGHDYFTQFNAHRTIAKKFDFTARLIYSNTTSRSTLSELLTGRDNTNPVGILVTSDTIDAVSNAKRPQTRGDLGITYLVTDKFRISNTLAFDQFAVNGGEQFREVWTKATGPELVKTTNSRGYRVNAYKRYINTIEGDYQFNNAVAAHIGYRYTHRMVNNTGYDVSCSTTTTASSCPPAAPTATLINETESNSTNTLIAGMKIKPVKNWSIFWDIEHGQADNVFTRTENYKFTNFRVRSRLTLNKVSLNLSAISKDDENPSRPSVTVIVPANVSYITAIKNRYFSGNVDWDPLPNLSFSTGYTYRHLDSYTPIAVPISGAIGGYVYGFSQFFVRDQYAFFDISAKPIKRLSIYASYRVDLDRGQGSQLSTIVSILTPNIIASYPMQFTTPEVRAVFRISRQVDWNVGYQYYNYKDKQTPFENYRAHLPYTSLRIYFGGGTADR